MQQPNVRVIPFGRGEMRLRQLDPGLWCVWIEDGMLCGEVHSAPVREEDLDELRRGIAQFLAEQNEMWLMAKVER